MQIRWTKLRLHLQVDNGKRLIWFSMNSNLTSGFCFEYHGHLELGQHCRSVIECKELLIAYDGIWAGFEWEVILIIRRLNAKFGFSLHFHLKISGQTLP